jgi:uncharacterized protein GlcG (DUF336 family)
MLISLSSICVLHAHAAGVPLDVAVEAAQAAIAACRSSGYQISITILNADYSTRVVLRDADVPEPTVEIGRRKAYTVIKTGMSSGDFGKTVPGQPPPPAPGAAPPPPPGPINGDPSLIPWAGGLPILAGGELLGAMSASGAPGGEKDEACVRAGLAVIARRLK